MKKFFAKPHNLLFTAAFVIFLQFVSAVMMTYVEYNGNSSIAEWSFYVYMVYCAAFCVITALFVIRTKKTDTVKVKGAPNENISEVKMWFSAIFLYIFFEVLFFVRLIYTAYSDISGFSLWGSNSTMTDSVYSLWDNLPIEKLYLCCALVFIIYCAVYILSKKKIYIIAAGVNLIVNALLIIFLPLSFTVDSADAGIAEFFTSAAIKEMGTLVLLVNLLVYGLYLFYKSDEK